MVGIGFDGDVECSTPPRDDEFNRYYHEEATIIEFGSDEFYDDIEHRSGYVKYTKLHIDNVLREETSNKKRKA